MALHRETDVVELFTQSWVVHEAAAHHAGCHIALMLLDATVSHTVVLGLDHNSDVVSLGVLLQRLRDLGRHFFLDLRTLGDVVDYTVELTQPNHLTIWDYTYPALAHNVLEVVCAG